MRHLIIIYINMFSIEVIIGLTFKTIAIVMMYYEIFRICIKIILIFVL